MPTTDDRDKYEEGERQREDFEYAHANRLWGFIFTCAGAVALAFIVTILIIVLNR